MKGPRHFDPLIPDEELARRLACAIDDDERDAALVELWRRYEPRPFGFARGACSDAVWLVLTRWHRRGLDYDARRPFLPFFTVCVWREWRKARRGSRRCVPLPDREDEQPCDPRDPTEEVCRADSHECLRREVSQLPERERAALESALAGQTYREGAAALGLSLHGYAQRLKRGRRQLERVLAQKLGYELARRAVASDGTLITYFVHDRTITLQNPSSKAARVDPERQQPRAG